VPSALYLEGPSVIQGEKTFISGYDACGGNDRRGILTPKTTETVAVYGHPYVIGAGGVEPDVGNTSTGMDVQALVEDLKKAADFSYVVNKADHDTTIKPGPGDGWGMPAPGATLEDASSCSTSRVVHYDTGETFVTLSDGVSGCGILLIEGDLKIQNDFSWYGPICVTGSVGFTGRGDKHISGALIVGGSLQLSTSCGTVSIIYCSAAMHGHTQDTPLRVLSWREHL
jgi:hypothetical protein